MATQKRKNRQYLPKNLKLQNNNRKQKNWPKRKEKRSERKGCPRIMIPNMTQTQNDGYPEKKEPDIEEHEKNVVRVKNSLERKVALVLDKQKLLIMVRNLLPIKELFQKVRHKLRNYPKVQDKPIENPKKARKKVEKTVF